MILLSGKKNYTYFKMETWIPLILLLQFQSYAQYNDFQSQLEDNLLQFHSQFSVVYNGEAETFLDKLNVIVTESVDNVTKNNVVIKSYEYSATYRSTRVKVSFSFTYVDTEGEIFETEQELVEFVFESLSEKKLNFKAGLKIKNSLSPNTIGTKVFNEANEKLEKFFHQVQVSTYECNITAYEDYIQFNFDILYVLPELLSNLYAETQEELPQLIFNQLEQRDTSFAIHIIGNGSSPSIDPYKGYISAAGIDEYLKNSIRSMSYRAIKFSNSRIVVFDVVYYANRDEEDYVERETDKIIKNILKPGMSIHEKEKAIHDFIVLNVKYDNTLEYGSAYDALLNKQAVCYGYTLLAQKLLVKAGIESIIINSASMKHTWNMVKIDNQWYHLDITWDDPIPDLEGRIVYDYYNLSDSEMRASYRRKHVWDYGAYPQANSTYQFNYENIFPGEM